MKKLFGIAILLLCVAAARLMHLGQPSAQVDKAPEPQVIHASIGYMDKAPVVVEDLRMVARFSPRSPGVHSYDPGRYYNTSAVCGEKQTVPFASLGKVVFTLVKVSGKRLIPEAARNDPLYAQQIDKDGYITASVTRILATMTSKDGKVLEDMIKEPDEARISLHGRTVFGNYDLSLYHIEEPLVVTFLQQGK